MNNAQTIDEVRNISFHVMFSTSYDQFVTRTFRYHSMESLLHPSDAHDLNATLRIVQTAELNKILALT